MYKKLMKGIALILCLGLLLSFTSFLNAGPKVKKSDLEMHWKALLSTWAWFLLSGHWFSIDNPAPLKKFEIPKYNYSGTKAPKITGDTPSDDPYPPGGGTGDNK